MTKFTTPQTPTSISVEEREFLIELGWSVDAIDLVSQHAHEDRFVRILNRLLREFPGRGKHLRSASRRRLKPKEKISGALRKLVFERDGYRCVTCGDWHDLSADHIVPESKGGPTTFENLQTMCRSCNSRKGAR